MVSDDVSRALQVMIVIVAVGAGTNGKEMYCWQDLSRF